MLWIRLTKLDKSLVFLHIEYCGSIPDLDETLNLLQFMATAYENLVQHLKVVIRQLEQSTNNISLEQLQRAGHEPVSLVPGSVDKYLHVPYCNLNRASTHILRGF